jgi:hypothetical protein
MYEMYRQYFTRTEQIRKENTKSRLYKMLPDALDRIPTKKTILPHPPPPSRRHLAVPFTISLLSSYTILSAAFLAVV